MSIKTIISTWSFNLGLALLLIITVMQCYKTDVTIKSSKEAMDKCSKELVSNLSMVGAYEVLAGQYLLLDSLHDDRVELFDNGICFYLKFISPGIFEISQRSVYQCIIQDSTLQIISDIDILNGEILYCEDFLASKNLGIRFVKL